MSSHERITRVAVTGGPSAGKSTLLRTIAEKYPTVICAPEIATILLSGGFPAPSERHPWSPVWQRNLQIAVAAAQIGIEGIMHERAAREEKRLIIFDRGLVDGAAYLPGGVSELEQITGETEEIMLGRYDAVLHLSSSAAHGAYDKTSNPHRFEEAEAALELEQRTLEAWQNHPNRIVLDEVEKAERVARGLYVVAEM